MSDISLSQKYPTLESIRGRIAELYKLYEDAPYGYEILTTYDEKFTFLDGVKITNDEFENERDAIIAAWFDDEPEENHKANAKELADLEKMQFLMVTSA